MPSAIHPSKNSTARPAKPLTQRPAPRVQTPVKPLRNPPNWPSKVKDGISGKYRDDLGTHLPVKPSPSRQIQVVLHPPGAPVPNLPSKVPNRKSGGGRGNAPPKAN